MRRLSSRSSGPRRVHSVSTRSKATFTLADARLQPGGDAVGMALGKGQQLAADAVASASSFSTLASAIASPRRSKRHDDAAAAGGAPGALRRS